eukprot:1254684-Amorphochlora_amoeboformis.AAC.1
MGSCRVYGVGLRAQDINRRSQERYGLSITSLRFGVVENGKLAQIIAIGDGFRGLRTPSRAEGAGQLEMSSVPAITSESDVILVRHGQSSNNELMEAIKADMRAKMAGYCIV